MKIKNPGRHLPHYAIRVHYPDGTQMNKRGSSQPEIDIPVESGEYLALIFECSNSAREVQIKLLLVDDKWVDFSEAVLAEMLAPKPKPKPKPEPKPKPKPKPEPKPEPDESDGNDGRYEIGCV